MGHAYEPERNYDTSLGRFRNLKFKSFETPQYCIKITSSDDDICRTHPKRRQNSSWDGGNIELHYITKDDEDHVATLETGEKEMEFCLPIDQVNISDDIFSLSATSTDGVCITSLTVNNEPLLVGINNDLTYFWMDENDLVDRCEDNYMATDVLEIQNGKVVYSNCKQHNIRRNDIQFGHATIFKTFDINIMLNLETNTESGWSNIFGFQQKGVKAYDNGFPIGSRIPAVWLRPNSNALHICMAINGNGNSCWNSPEMPVDTWFELNIRQIYDQDNKRYSFQIFIDGELKRTVTNNQPIIFDGVEGIIGHSYEPERDYKAAVGQFRDFMLHSHNEEPWKLPPGFEVGSDVIPSGLTCSSSSGNSRIVGGGFSQKGSWPWLVSLMDEEGHFCGGTILSNTRILTAAHCLLDDGEVIGDFSVSVGNWNLNDNEETGEFKVPAKNVRIHPKYDDDKTGYGSPGYDFAIIEIPDLSTVKPASCIDCYDFACLPTEHAAHGRACWTGGWGAIEWEGRGSDFQKEAGVHIMDFEYCMNNSKYPDDEIVDDIEFCAGRPDLNGNGLTQEGETVCQGDSGGPLICNDNGRPVVYGVTSWLEDCGLAGFPSIFAKVASELDWIKEQL